MKEGIVTIATGDKKYINMAIALGISISINSPGIQTAIITDSDNLLLKKLFNYIIPPPDGNVSGFFLKTALYDYTPFDKTIFIDSDCLVMKNLSVVFDKLKNEQFVLCGEDINSGFWYTDIESLLKKIGRTSIPKFNSGFIFFIKTVKTKKIFQEAQDVFHKQDYYEIQQFKGSCPDEPCFAIGMAKEDVSAYPWRNGLEFSATPVGLVGKMHVDSIKGMSSWKLNDIGKVSPFIIHFVSRINYHEYQTELIRLMLYYAGGWKKKLMPVVSFWIYWTIYFRRFAGELYHRFILRDK